MDGLWPVLAGIKDTATLVLILVLGGLGWLHLSVIRENRQDRRDMMELLQKNTEAINGMKTVLAALTGKVL